MDTGSSGLKITLEQIADLPESTYTLADVRDEISFRYGTIPQAKHMPDVLRQAENGALDKTRKYILFCMHGLQSVNLAGQLRALGFQAWSLEGGYGAWLRKNAVRTDRSAEIEASITRNRRYKERLFGRFTKAVVEFDLVQPGDRIAVCISGGKDSMLMAKLFQALQRCRKFPFELVFLVMDPGYNELNRLLIESNAAAMGVPVTIFETTIFDAVYHVEQSPCYLCARMRRGHLYKKAQELGCNKIALGHHYDDVIETILMGMLWSGQIQTMLPKLHSQNFAGMELIRPMYYIREEDIEAWRDLNGLHFIQCACHFTDTCSSCRTDGAPVSKRMETKQLIRTLRKTNPYVEVNIFNSVRSVNLNTVLGFKKDGLHRSFLDGYNE